MIKNIVFDMGNVLLDFDPEVSLNLFCASEEEKDLIRRELFHWPEWALADKGEIKDKDRYEYVKKRIPKKYWHALEQCAYHWDVCKKPIPQAKEFCQYVKEKGYGIYVLSNASDMFYSYFPAFAPLDYFDGIVVSSDYHLLKPDLEIYKLFLKKFCLVPKECLFIDDREDNVQGAIKAGMQSIVFQNNFSNIREVFQL